ncbi:hypothetical protein Aple_005430 [Acrocarpospora pleiomorpha]|uniref:PPM-type phosphatase domain-containing protein n=1 Tax=Acrocarpospora pleiomorpha TaxID=90975 RepID=A0A5M3XHT5_9ACTN|nr:hypothetical protein [Acrocarpospora pleiomorpha]GES17648.1 hypothetical protein Aple_005430 [Acrocarpospora pleiomorpha]
MHTAEPGDRYLLCSDGLSTVVATESLRHVLTGTADPEQVLDELVGLAYAAGAPDNIACVVSGTFTRARRHGALMASAAAVWGGTVVILGLAPHLWLALAALTLGGAVNFLLSTFRNAISQAHTDDALRGRIQGSLTVVLLGGPQLAHLLHGVAASAFGPQLTICAGGLLTVTTVAVIVRLSPHLWHYTD